MYILFEFITTISLIAIIHIFLQGMFEKKSVSPWMFLAAYCVYGIGLIIFSLFPEQSILRMMYNTGSMVVLCLLLFNASFPRALFASVSMSAICVLTDILLFALYTVLGLDTAAMMELEEIRMVYTATSQMVCLLIILILLRITHRRRSAVTLPFILMLTPGYVVSIIIGCQFSILAETHKDIYSAPFILTSVILVYLNILIVFYAERVKESAQKQKEFELSEHHYVMQEQYYEQLRSEQNDTRALFHDINKYLCAMRALAGENQSEKASQVLKEAQSLFDDIGNVVDVGNSVVSIIISQYAEAAETDNIAFEYDISVPPELPISASDAYILIGNTIDNAIEACAAVQNEEKYIHLKLRQVNDILFYQIENPYNKNARKRESGKYHGYGLKSVKRCIEKYDGDMSIKKDNGVFTISARMNVVKAAV